MKKTPLIASLVTGLMLIASPVFSDNTISITNKGLYPEGISYNAKNDSFYISSVARGEIWVINKKGEGKLFSKNDKFASTIGLHVDNERNRLLVCVSDPGVGENTNPNSKGKLAGLAVYDLSSKKEIAYYNLSSSNDNKGHFANDITVDNEGNSYVTDSFSPIIYKIDTTGKISTLISSEKWQVAPGKFGLNGIVYHPNGYLIVAHYETGKLYKIDLGNPKEIREISIKQISKQWRMTGLDGLLLLNNETLIAVNNDSSGRDKGNFVFRLSSDSNWDNAKFSGVMPTGNTFPTTLTNNGDDVFVLHAKLATLFMGNKIPEKTFEIEPVLFSD